MSNIANQLRYGTSPVPIRRDDTGSGQGFRTSTVIENCTHSSLYVSETNERAVFLQKYG